MITRTHTSYDTGAAVTKTESLFVGATLALHHNSTRVMSDVWETLPYATVFNAETGKVEVVWRSSGPATVDATPETIAAANAWLLAAATTARKNKWAGKVAAALEAARKPSKGKTVTVVKGRKVAKGTTGTVIWVGAGKSYSYYDSGALRVGVKDAAGTVHWTAASNVEVVNPDDYFPFEELVTMEPNHEDEARTEIAAPAYGAFGKYAVVTLSAGEDRIGFSNWFALATVEAVAA